jgi:hypothetical protein
MAGWWAYKFYGLRNTILHEGHVSPEDLAFKGWITQLIVADLVFTECVRDRLFNMGCMGERERKMVSRWGEIPGCAESAARILMRNLEVPRALGWMT